MHGTRCCVLFTKPAHVGEVKTRLIGILSPAQAAELHRAFQQDLEGRLARGSFDLRIAWALEPTEDLPPSRFVSERQIGETLGDRLFHGLDRASREFDYVLAIGSDHPEIPLERVESAFELMEGGAKMVLGPASDGGYYLIGFWREALDSRLFEGIAWSSPSVTAQTLTRAAALGTEAALLPTGNDVDSPADLERLVAYLHSNPSTCHHTEALLRSWGRLR